MKFVNSSITTLTGFALSAVLAVGSALADNVNTINGVGPDREFPRVWRDYQGLNKDFARVGTPRTVATIRKIDIGSSKRQLVNAVGQPVSAYSDGSWNFNVALPLPQRNKLICQYRVYFDDADRVAGTLWRRPQCANIVTGQ